jgi:hypothetical protein
VTREKSGGKIERLLHRLERLAALSDIRINAVKVSAEGSPQGLALEKFMPFAAFSLPCCPKDPIG